MSTVRAWVMNAASGVKVGEVRLAGSSSWTQRFGGGPLRAGISVKHLTTRSGGSLDWAAIRQVRDWCEGGRHSLVLTDGDRVMGEWMLARRTTGTSADGIIPVIGFELDGYPAFRTLRKPYAYGAIDIAHLARNLLLDAFTWDNPVIQIRVPTYTAGIDIACSYLYAETYYGEILEDLAEADQSVEWRIRTEPIWADGELAAVDRWVHFGAPRISVDTPMVIDYDGPGFHSGNCESFFQDIDWTLSRSRVHGVGAGEGDDQITWEAEWAAHQANGFLNRDGLVSRPSVSTSGDLGRLVRGERDTGKSMLEPARATVVLEGLQALPRIGDNVWVDIEPTYSLPEGVERSMRVGEVVYNVRGHELRTANLLLA